MFKRAIPVWIEGKEKELNSICAFFTSFKGEGDFTLRITGNSFFRIFLNGSFVAFGPARGAHGYCRVDEIKLQGIKGENSLFIEVAGYNAISYWSVNTPAFLQAEVLFNDEVIAFTGKDFLARKYSERLQKVLRFSYQRDFTECYRFSNLPSETYVDFKNHTNGEEIVMPVEVKGNTLLERIVSYPKYEILSSKAVEYGNFEITNKEPIHNIWLMKEGMKSFKEEEFESYPYLFIQNLKFNKDSFKDDLKKGQYTLFDVGYGSTGFLKTSFTAKEDSVVLITFDEINLSDKEGVYEIKPDRIGTANVIEYNVKKGSFQHITFEPYSARFINIIVKEGAISNGKVEIITYENPDCNNFYFNCKDERVNEIIEASKRTFKQNAVDVLTDCPSRERAGWLCDSYFSSRAEQLFTGKNLVEECMLQNYALYTPIRGIPENMIPMCYPADFETEGYIPNWALWYIIEIYDMYKRTENKNLVELSRKNVENIIKYFDQYINEYGLLENLGGWIFVEWSKANDDEFVKGINYPSNMIYCKALKCAGEMYGNINWQERAEKIKNIIRKESFNGTFFEDNRVRIDGKPQLVGHITETCQYYAFFSGIATIEEYPQLFQTLIKYMGASRDDKKVYPNVYKSNAFIGNYLRLIMIRNSPEKERIAEECVQYFYNMAIKTGTLWENDNIFGSLNHGFASYAANLIIDYMSGYCGMHGNRLMFSKPAVKDDCKIVIPVKDDVLIYERKNGKENIQVPKGYTVERV